MSKFFDLTGAAFAGLRLPALLAALALALGPVLALVLHRRKPRPAIWILASTSAVFLFAAHIALVRFGPTLSSKDLADRIATVIRPNDVVMIYGDQAYGSSLAFYLQRRMFLVNGRSTSLLYGSNYPDAPHIFLNDSGLVRAWHGKDRLFLFVPPEKRQSVEWMLGKPQLFAESSGKAIYTNQ
jgi:hypothetical protein